MRSSNLPLHIVFLTPGFPHDESETHCMTYFQKYLLALKKTHETLKIQVISFHYPYLPGNYTWHGIPVYALGGANAPVWGKIALWRKVEKLVKQIHKAQPIDYLHSLWLKECCLIGHRASRKYNIPHINTVMGTEVFEKNKYLSILPLAKLNLACVSDFQRQKLLETQREMKPVQVIPWGIPQLAEDFSLPYYERPFDLLTVGFLNKTKQIPLFLEIVRACKTTFPTIKALIIGRDYSEGSLDEQITKLDLIDNIIKYPLLPNEEVISLMKKSKVLVHTSEFESQGYVFLEALRSAMYIVSRPVGIARAGEQWILASDQQTFVNGIKKALKAQQTKEIMEYPVKDTVSKYWEIYGSHI